MARFAASAFRALVKHLSGSSAPDTGKSRPVPRPGRAQIGYAPTPGDTADPGEIVWAWVPYEEDPSRGKDRPVLVIGTEGSSLLSLMLTSRDRNNGTSRDAGYLDIGTGSWDRQGRPSEVNLRRLIRLDPAEVRRIGAVLDRPVFDRVIAAWEQSAGG